ncbi:uncharacterized protein LOC115214195 [Argonauta hians]
MFISSQNIASSAFNILCRHITHCKYMVCNMKICRLRRRAVGSFFLLLILCGVVVVYAALLRSSKSSGSVFRLQKKHSHHRFRKGNKNNASALMAYSKDKNGAISHELPVYVVEDHQEVLSHWTEAGNNGIIRKSGNTLVHIDAKANFNIPSLFPGHSHFKWPPQNQMDSMNHSKDTFIMSALISGLYNRYVWVWPKWDTKSHIKTHIIVYAYFGRISRDNTKKPPGKTAAICFCISYFKRGTKTCTVQHGNTEKSIPHTQCHIKRYAKIEKIREDLALESLQNGKLIRKDENVVLDIDEEYIGHEISFAPLFAAGLTFSNVSLINKEVQKIICPKVMKDEQKADNVLSKVIFEISKLRRRFCMKKKPEMCLKFPYSKNFSSALHTFTNSLTSLSPALGCKKKIGTKYVEKFVLQLASFKEKQLLAIREIGFCFAPLSKSLSLEYHFQLCLGGSVLNSSSGHLRSLQQQEVVSRTKFFQKFMSLSKFQPRIITLARSIRSGFTSRKYFHKIEREILASLRAFHSKLQIHYDSGLLGGKFGWPKRHSQNTTVRQH